MNENELQSENKNNTFFSGGEPLTPVIVDDIEEEGWEHVSDEKGDDDEIVLAEETLDFDPDLE